MIISTSRRDFVAGIYNLVLLKIAKLETRNKNGVIYVNVRISHSSEYISDTLYEVRGGKISCYSEVDCLKNHKIIIQKKMVTVAIKNVLNKYDLDKAKDVGEIKKILGAEIRQVLIKP